MFKHNWQDDKAKRIKRIIISHFCIYIGIIFFTEQKNFMPDNPNKKRRDGKTVSQQPHEQAYQKKKQNNQGKQKNRNGVTRSKSRGMDS